MKIDYYAYRSGLKHWNPGLKMLLAVGTLFLTVGADKLILSLFVAAAMSAVTLLAGRIPWRVYLHFMTLPITFMIFSGLAIAVQFAKAPIGEWNIYLHFFWLCFTRESIGQAAEVFFKALAGMSALYMMSFSTPIHEIILVLQKLHVPKLIVELMSLIYRYIFILYDVAAQMQTAARARLGDRTFIQSMRTFAGIAGNLFLLSLRKANAYYDALLARGYDGRLEFLTEESPVRKGQIISVICYFILLAMLAVIL